MLILLETVKTLICDFALHNLERHVTMCNSYRHDDHADQVVYLIPYLLGCTFCAHCVHFEQRTMLLDHEITNGCVGTT
jgi:hypothetical protein